MKMYFYKVKKKIIKEIDVLMSSFFEKSKFYNRYIFSKIYDKDLFNLGGNNTNPISKSGPGSDLLQTKEILINLPFLIKKYNINSILDIPCGDFYWMNNVELLGAKYIGADIVKTLIKKNKDTFTSDKVSFISLDILTDDLPKVDLILCRDLFVHLKNDQIKIGLKNIKKSGSKYLLTTSFKDRFPNGENLLIGGWRPLNLEIEPFNLKKSIDEIFENCTEAEGKFTDKYLLLFEVKDLKFE
ncbi:class I SAM-dependent methyltransferase [Flavobacterium petrolei]|uniref:Class I SAM-dependent methyltransferase n=1 Tax=Flavobacterium petrolei TaxID=2259594 RepID=A0A482TLS2_9FLAO|nr:class I SAM-dependent methyltransferase [Flavobacterium petrolei]RYJ50879.1 class I SAM-dependent methyltransferase [Flavobacterium petrolei]